MIIGLAGYAGAGKDTVGDVLISKHGYSRIAFADKIRSFLYDINPIIKWVANEPIYLQKLVNDGGWDTAKQNSEVRRLLQDLGVSGRNLFGEDIWIWEALGWAVYAESNKNNDDGVEGSVNQNIVVTDVRFENEAKFIKEFGGQVWQVVRDGVKPINDHISEVDLIGYDFDKVIYNNGSREDIEAQIDL